MPSGEPRPEVRLLPNRPAPNDEFGSHEQIASALLDLVNNEPGGLAVGLAGGYGVGKSTVIQLLRSRIAQDEDVLLWTFDAWAHEGDPLRMTFLETLVEEITAAGWFREGEVDGVLASVSGRTKEETSSARPRLTRIGHAVATAALFAPAGLVLLAEGLDLGVTFRSGGAPNWLAIVGAFFALMPLIVILGVWLWTSIFSRDRDRGWHFLEKEREVRTTTTSRETPEPTSLEFERAFTSIANTALVGSDRKMVVVLDNLDRVRPTRAFALWSTLQTFLRDRFDAPHWYEKLWIVVPFDPDAMGRLWSDSDGQDVARAFLEKSFQVVLRVPPPILSDWRRFFVQKCATALPRVGGYEAHQLARIFALVRRPDEGPPTPRDLKVFLNQIAAQLLARDSTDIPVAVVAYYAALRRRPANDLLERIRTGRIPSDDVRPYLPANAGVGLAALEYGVPMDLAAQILLEDGVREALEAGQSERLDEVAHFDAAWPVVEKVVHRAVLDWKAGNNGFIPLAYVALNESEVWHDAPEHERRAIDDLLRSSLNDLSRWTPFDESVARAIAVWLSTVGAAGSEGTERQLIRLLQATIGHISAAAEWDVSLASSTIVSLRERGVSMPRMVISGDVERLASLLDELNNLDPDVNDPAYYEFDSAGGDKEVIASLVRIIESPTMSAGHFAAVRTLARQRDHLDWSPVLKAAGSRLRHNQSVTPDFVNWDLAIVQHLSGIANDASELEALASEGHLAHHFKAAHSASAWPTASRILLVLLDHDPSLSPTGSVGQSTAGYQAILQSLQKRPRALVIAVAKLVVNHQAFDTIWSLRERDSSLSEFSGRVVSECGRFREFRQWLTPAHLVEEWEFASRWLNIDELLGSEEFAGGVQDELEKEPEIRGREGLYAGLLSKTGSQGLRDRCEDYLHGMPSGEWEAAMKDGSDLLTLGVALGTFAGTDVLGGELEMALKRHARRIQMSEVEAIPSPVPGRLATLLSAEYREILQKNLWELATEQPESLPPAFFEAFGEELVLSGALSEKNKPISDFVIPVLEGRSEPGVSWLADVVKENSSALGRMDQPYRRELQRQLDRMLEEGEDGHLEHLLTTIREGLAGE